MFESIDEAIEAFLVKNPSLRRMVRKILEAGPSCNHQERIIIMSAESEPCEEYALQGQFWTRFYATDKHYSPAVDRWDLKTYEHLNKETLEKVRALMQYIENGEENVIEDFDAFFKAWQIKGWECDVCGESFMTHEEGIKHESLGRCKKSTGGAS